MEKRSPELTVETKKETAWITINRASDRNSLNSRLMQSLSLELDTLEASPVRAVVFQGAGETHFIGGADGVEMMQCDPPQAQSFSQRIQALFQRLEASPLLMVAAIDGLCFGGGFEFAMACDLRVATARSRIGLPEVKVGLIPGGGGTQRLPRLVGIARALEMILEGRLYPAPQALEMGLVHRVVTPETLRTRIAEWLARMLCHPSYALSGAKRAIYASQYQESKNGLATEQQAFSECFKHAFFADLMRQQLRSKTLSTTEDITPLIEPGVD